MDVCISLTEPDGKKKSGWTFRKREDISSLLLKNIIPRMVTTLPGQTLAEDHSWCFVMPSKKDRFYFGAFLPTVNFSEAGLVFALHCPISYPVLCRSLESNFHIAFWLSRILDGYQRPESIVTDKAALQEWVGVLKHSFSPFWERLLINEQYRFGHRSVLLLSELTGNEEKLNNDSGVEIMPWQNWPGCIQMEKKVWLWKQSRYGRIIDSQSIKLYVLVAT